MDITTSGIFFGKMSYSCHIHVISDFQKRYIWINLVYPKLKKLHLVYTRYIFSCHMPYLSMSYPCHKFVRLSGSLQLHALKWNSAWKCIAVRVLHTTAQRSSSTTRFIHHHRARGLLLCPLPWWGRRQRGLLRASGPPQARAPAGAGAAGTGSAGAVAAGTGASSSAGSACGGSAGVSGFLGVLDSARTLGAVTLLAPAMPSTPS